MRYSLLILTALGTAMSASSGSERSMSGEDFWFYRLAARDRLEIRHEDATTVVGRVFGRDKASEFEASKKEICSTGAKTRGAVRALRFQIAIIRDSSIEEQRAGARSRAHELTGESLESDVEWTRWLDSNEPHLFYSDLQEKLLVDADAKRERRTLFPSRHGAAAVESRGGG